MIDFEQTSLKFSGNFHSNSYSMAIQASLFKALALDHKLRDEIVGMSGMSGKKYRYFINNLISLVPNPRYLEVGSYAGSTACSALDTNTLKITCIDNWSEFGGPKDVFLKNISQYSNDSVQFQFLEDDFRKINYAEIGKYNIYLFDGPHTEIDQYDGINIALPALDDQFILIVDDYNWPNVRNGTQRAMQESLSIISSIEIRTTQNDEHPNKAAFENSDWHNGYYFAVCKKL